MENKIKDSRYIYVIGQFDDNGKLMFNKSFKIGKADNLKQRFNQEYKNNTGYFDPRYIRLIEVSKSIHNVPDKPLHALLLFCEPLIIRESKHRELFAFDGPEALEYFDNKLYDFPAIIKYYKDPQEIKDLVEKESIINEVIKNLVNAAISENGEDILDENSDFSDNDTYNKSIKIQFKREIKKIDEYSENIKNLFEEFSYKFIELKISCDPNKPLQEPQRKNYIRDLDILFYIIGLEQLNMIYNHYNKNEYMQIRYILEKKQSEIENHEIHKEWFNNGKSGTDPVGFSRAFNNCIIKLLESYND